MCALQTSKYTLSKKRGKQESADLSPLTNIYCLSAPQSLIRRPGPQFRAVLFVVALVFAGGFGLLYMSLLMTAIYLVAIAAATLFAIARA